jgi:hypothetical protein
MSTTNKIIAWLEAQREQPVIWEGVDRRKVTQDRLEEVARHSAQRRFDDPRNSGPSRIRSCMVVNELPPLCHFPEVSSLEFQSVMRRYFLSPVGHTPTLNEMRDHLEAIGITSDESALRLTGVLFKGEVYMIVDTYRAIRLIQE